MMKRTATMHHSITLSRVSFFGLALVVVCLIGPSAYALDPLGPPIADLHKGEYKIGLDVSMSSQDLETSLGYGSLYVNGAYNSSGPVYLGTIKDFKTYRAYVNVGTNLISSWEGFLRMGATTAELGDEFQGQGEKYDSRTEFTIGGGIRTTFYEEFALKIGGLAQVNWTEYDGHLDASSLPAPHFVEINLLEAQVALGATYLLSDRVAFYGGPFAHVIYGDIDYVFSDVSTAGDLQTWRFSWDVEDSINYGGYLGATITLKRDCTFNIEYQQTNNANAIGASLLWRI